MNIDPSYWSVQDVKKWLDQNGFDECISILCDTHQIDGKVLMTMNFKDFISKPICMKVYGHVRRLCLCINALKRNHSYRVPQSQPNFGLLSSTDTSDEELSRIVGSGKDVLSSVYEFKRCLLSFIYLFVSCYFVSISMVIVHNRVPDMAKYPPLPDIVLENLPLIPWAFKASEILMIFSFLIWLSIVIFHQYRFIIIKRYCNIFGTVFLLRSLTLLSTSLSVPGKHHQCVSQVELGL
ncbi:hypothetical protein HZS_3092 [Henneguya salminicola]|nr:hypothetical protein HZS_3092 [Henneguya salminicola]